MKLHSLYIILCLCCLPALTSCRDDAVLPDGQSNVPAKTLLVLNFTIDGKDAASRTGADDTPEHPEADWENNIATLQVFIEHADGTWEDPIYIWNVNTTKSSYTIEIELDKVVDLTGATIYLGANLTLAQSQSFIKDNTYSFSTAAFDLVTDFAPYSTDDYVDRPHIAMFCTKGLMPREIANEDETHTYKYDFSEYFTLKRMVAKVLVTCEKATDVNDGESNVNYVPVKQTENSNFQGWIRQEDVKYLVNGLNRKAYIMQQIDEDATEAYANVIDPNNTLSGTGDNSDFFFKPIEELDACTNQYFRTSLPFEKERLSNNNINPYTEGIYCPENTFALDESIVLNGQQAQITHVCVAARFTPKLLHIEEDLLEDIKEKGYELPEEVQRNEKGMVECPTEAVARLLLASSLEMNSSDLPEGTYVYNNITKEFYTYGASAINASGDINEYGNFTLYRGGWGYYYTYVDNRLDNNSTPDDFEMFYRHGQVERNRYYILNIKSFSNPTMSASMDVHTISLEWKTGGSGNITLNPDESTQNETTD